MFLLIGMKTKKNRPICVPIRDKHIFKSPDEFVKWAKKESYCTSQKGVPCPSTLEGWMTNWGASYKSPGTCRRLLATKKRLHAATMAAYKRHTACTRTRCSTFYKDWDATRNSIANKCKNHKKYFKCFMKEEVPRELPNKEAQFNKCGTRKCRKEKSIADRVDKQEFQFIQRHLNPDVL